MKRFGVAMAVFAIAFLVSVGVVRAQEHPWFDDPGQPGHFAVGHTGYLLADPSRSDRPIYFMVWYPVDPNSITSSTPPAQYPFDRVRQRNAPSASEARVMKWGNERKTRV